MIESYVKTKDGKQAIKAYTVSEAIFPICAFKDRQRNHKITKWATKYICLDTETSHKGQEVGWIYQWAAKLGGLYVYGRKPSEIIDLMQKIAEHYKLNANKKMIVYIHNASYDLQYLKLFLRKYDPTADFLAIDSHSIIQCDVLGFRILCSYKLTNMSLDALAKKYAATYAKAVGEIDYNIIRYQDDELKNNDWFYMFSDVAAQDDGIKGYLTMQGYLYAFQAPITSTGFVRTNCRKAARAAEYWRDEFINGSLTLEQYNLCRQCFMGGVCISSFMHNNKTIRRDDLKHDDFCSSYPARQILDYFPTGRGSWFGDVEDEETLNDLLETYCCVFILTINNVHIKKGVTAPCIPSSKCIHKDNYLKVNGKIVSADTLTIVVCELDYKWIRKQYDFDEMDIDKMLIFERGEVPDWMKKEVFAYFENKCTLKNKDPLLYNKSKNMLNGIYGMTATAIIRDVFKMDDEYILEKKAQTDDEKKTALNKYYNSYNNFMPYQFAIWTTAHARNALYTMIEATGNSDGKENDLTEVYCNFLYCDTDSVFYIETDQNKLRMEKLRQSCRKRAKAAGAYVGDKYLGEPTPEPPLRAFRSIHAKCYAMEEWDEDTNDYQLNVVIAGIPKKSIKWIDGKPVEKTNAQELGSIDNLQDGFVFKHCGGTRCIYNERPIGVEMIDGHETEFASSAIIENIEKEISDTMYTAGEDYTPLHIVQNAQ